MGIKGYHERRLYDLEVPISAVKFFGFHYLAHWHYDIEIIYVVKGIIKIGVNSDVKIVGKGDMVVCGSGDIHYFEEVTEELPVIIIILCHPSIFGIPKWPEEDKQLIKHYISKEEFDNLVLSKEIPAYNLENIFNNMVAERESKRPYYDLIIKGQIMQLMGIIKRINKKDKPGIQNRETTEILQNAINYICERYMDDLSLEKMAEKANLSVYHFSRLFKKVSGKNYKNFLNTIRVENAEKLMIEENYPISDIAIECGFNNMRTFNRVFKEIRGKTPSELRKEYRKQVIDNDVE